MAKDIPEETTADEIEPRYSPEEKEAVVKAVLTHKKKRLCDVVADSGLPKSTVHDTLAALADRGQVTRHGYGFYSLAPGVEAPAPKPRAKKAAPVEAPAPAEDEPVVFSPEETGILAYLAKPGLLALLAKVERLG